SRRWVPTRPPSSTPIDASFSSRKPRPIAGTERSRSRRNSMTKAGIILVFAAAAAWAASGHLTVSVEEAKIRKKKLFYAPAIASVRYGDKVEVGDKEGGWYSVSYKGQDGWLHESAVATKVASAKSGSWSGSSSASAEEATLAGKGFNESVEKSYKK